MAAPTMPWTVDPAVEKFFRELPLGCAFQPTDEELVVHYLRNKILNLPMPPNRIRTFNAYDTHPLRLYRMYGVIREDACYYFTARDGTRSDRTGGGDGFWEPTTGDIPVMSGNTAVGSKRTLVYHQGTPLESVKSDWVMEEYVLNHTNSLDTPVDEYVLVKIYQNQGHT